MTLLRYGYALLLIAACAKPSNTVVVQPTYSSIRTNIITPRCMECHQESVQEGGVDLSDYAKVKAYTVPGTPDGSALYEALKSGEMPKDRPKLSAQELAAVREWIARGSNND